MVLRALAQNASNLTDLRLLESPPTDTLKLLFRNNRIKVYHSGVPFTIYEDGDVPTESIEELKMPVTKDEQSVPSFERVGTFILHFFDYISTLSTFLVAHLLYRHYH